MTDEKSKTEKLSELGSVAKDLAKDIGSDAAELFSNSADKAKEFIESGKLKDTLNSVDETLSNVSKKAAGKLKGFLDGLTK